MGGNHYLAFGLDKHVRHRGRSPAEVCEAVRDRGGVGFAAHPWSKGSERFKNRARGMPFRDLASPALHGVELWSFATDTAEGLRSIPEIVGFLARPGHVLRHPPERNLRAWDELCQQRPTVAIGGLDAHQFGRRIGPFVPLRLMSYRRSFRFIRTHVLVDGPLDRNLDHDRAQVYGALRAGRCYIAVDAVAPAAGFDFWAEGPSRRVEMGAVAPAGDWSLRVALPAAASVRVLRDGREIGRGLYHRIDEPGVYRVEAYREAHGAERTWILSNPIYLR
jgi:hypothetical protein